MSNKKHLKRLLSGVKAWNAWRTANPFERVDISDTQISCTDLREADLSGVNLSRSNLREADLSGANLREADLSGADLSRAMLNQSDLTHTNLHKAILHEATLREANLTMAVLVAAKLTDADLSGANLTSANLKSANFKGAFVEFTTFGNNDLSTVEGLDDVQHLGPSTVGVDTLINSKGKIPEVFLRGVGLPDAFTTYLPSLVAQPIEFYSCFISYSHADKSFACRLHDTLQGRGIRCWLDEHQLLPGEKIYTEVDRGIRLWDKVLLCCSKDALTSWWVDNEIKIAFDKEQYLWRERKKEVLALIPINLDDYLFSGQWQSGLATEVKARMAANFGGWEGDNKKFEAQFERLVKALRTDSGRKEPPPPRLL